MQIFFVSSLTCVVLIFLLRKLALRYGFVDHPGGRKLHANPTPTVGGLAMYLAVLLTLLESGQFTGNLPALLGCAAALVVLGLFDDRYGLPVSLRLIIEVVLVLFVITSADGMISHLGALFGTGDIGLTLLALPLSVVAYVGGINAMNMIDGVDGIAGKMALITCTGVALIFHWSGAMQLMPLTWAIMGALIGFLFFNARWLVRHAWVFMGDAGSMWLGLVLGWFMAQLTHGTVAAQPPLVFWLFGIPLIDTLAVMFRRLRRNGKPFAADRTHIHHVLQHAGLSVRRTVLTLSVAQAVLVGTAVGFYLLHVPAAVVFWSFVLLIAAYCYVLRHHSHGLPDLRALK